MAFFICTSGSAKVLISFC